MLCESGCIFHWLLDTVFARILQYFTFYAAKEIQGLHSLSVRKNKRIDPECSNWDTCKAWLLTLVLIAVDTFIIVMLKLCLGLHLSESSKGYKRQAVWTFLLDTDTVYSWVLSVYWLYSSKAGQSICLLCCSRGDSLYVHGTH